MTLYEDPVERDTSTATTTLTYTDNLHAYDFYTSPPLILRSYTSLQTSNNSSTKNSHQQQHTQQHRENLNELTNKNSCNMRLSIEYIHRLIEQNERRYEQQEHITLISQEWQILSQVVDRLLVFLFLISTMLVFFLIFRQALLLRLK